MHCLVHLQDDSDWIKLNAGQYGLFRVNYPMSIWANLATAASSPPAAGEAPAVPAEDLAGLLDDSWALAQAGETPINHFLDLTRCVPLLMYMEGQDCKGQVAK